VITVTRTCLLGLLILSLLGGECHAVCAQYGSGRG
jgi:hypothetical protein